MVFVLAWASHLEVRKVLHACSRWGSSDSPDHPVQLGASLVKFRAVAGQPEQQPLAFMSVFFYPAPLSLSFSLLSFPYNLTFMCILEYY